MPGPLKRRLDFPRESSGKARLKTRTLCLDLVLGPEDEENVLESSIPLKIAFSILRLSRENPEESVLRAMLMNLEQDLLDEEFADKPMLFSVFGKGRVLPPLVGLGINEDNALGDCSYLCGPCSCQVKNQNPGMDLLVKADWWAALEGSSVIEEKALPPLSGVEDLIATNEPDLNRSEVKNSSSQLVTAKPEGRPDASFPKGLVLAVVFFSIILLVGTFVLNKNREA